MDKLDIILAVMLAGFGSISGLLLVMWNSLSARLDRVDVRIDKVENNLDVRIDKVENNLGTKIDKLDEKVTDIDRRLCRLEGAFSNKECCMIKEDRNLKAAE